MSVPPGRVPFVIDLPVRAIAISATAAIAVLLAAGVAVAILTIAFGRDELLGLGPMFHLNGERNVPAWFSSMLLLAAATALAAAASGSRDGLRGRWALLGGVFLYLSIDEFVALHEMTNAPLRAIFHAGPWFYFPWVALGICLAGAVAVASYPLLKALPSPTRRQFVLAGALYVLGAAGLEMIAAPLYAIQGPKTLAHAALVSMEEGLEMISVAVFLIAVMRYVGARGTAFVISLDEGAPPDPHGVRVPPRTVSAALLVVVIGLALANLAALAAYYLAAAEAPALVRLVDLSREGNIPTWYQSVALLGCAVAAGIIAKAERSRTSRYSAHWGVVAVIFLLLSFDEAVAIHELPIRPLRIAFATSGLLDYLWVFVGAAVTLTGAVGSRRFIGALPQPTRRALLLGTAVFLAGAVVVQAFSAAFAELHGRDDLRFGLITTAEEMLEMIGVLIVLRALLEHVRVHVGTLHVTVGARS